MDKLVSLNSSKHGASSSPPATVQLEPTVPSLAQTFAQVLSTKSSKRVVMTSQDVKQLPRLNGSADIDVISCLQQYRLVCSFRVKVTVSSGTSESELVKLSDQAAFEHLSLICDGPVLTLYQHIMDGSHDWNTLIVSTEATDAPGSHPAPTTWSEQKTALLDCLMPSSSVEESALRLAEFKMDSSEPVASYAPLSI